LELDSGPVVPNPFNPTMQIIYGIPATAGSSRVVLLKQLAFSFLSPS